MKVIIAAVGKIKPSPEKQLIEKYLQRLSWHVDIKEVEEKKAITGEKLKQSEGRLLLGCVPKNAKIIVLDERGKDLTSIEFASKLQKFEDNGFSQFVFLIGGADGHSDEVKGKADLLLSLGILHNHF